MYQLNYVNSSLLCNCGHRKVNNKYPYSANDVNALNDDFNNYYLKRGSLFLDKLDGRKIYIIFLRS